MAPSLWASQSLSRRHCTLEAAPPAERARQTGAADDGRRGHAGAAGTPAPPEAGTPDGRSGTGGARRRASRRLGDGRHPRGRDAARDVDERHRQPGRHGLGVRQHPVPDRAPGPRHADHQRRQKGLWSSTDGGTSWKQLWPSAGTQQITNRGSSIVFDPAAPRHLLGVGHLQRPRRLPHDRQRRDVHAARRRAPHRLRQRRPGRCAAPDAAGGRPRAATDPLSVRGRRRHLDQRRQEPALRHEFLHQRAGHRQGHPPGGLLRLRGRHRRRLPHDRRRQDLDARHRPPRRPRCRSGPRTAQSTGRSSTTAA